MRNFSGGISLTLLPRNHENYSISVFYCFSLVFIKIDRENEIIKWKGLRLLFRNISVNMPHQWLSHIKLGCWATLLI